LRQRPSRRSHRGEVGRLECAEPARKPGGTAGADAAERALAVLGQREPGAAAVGLALRAGDEAVALEPGDALRHRGGRDALLRGELADGEARCVLDRDQQADLLWRDAGDLLPAKLASQAEQCRTQAVGHRHRIELLLRRLSHYVTRLAKRLTWLPFPYRIFESAATRAGGRRRLTRFASCCRNRREGDLPRCDEEH